MSIFSQLLQEHFQEKKVKIYQIAQLSNIERTLLQKILTGSRKPSSEEQVTRLAQALMLTASETKELQNAYQILHMGEENWHRRSAVWNLMQSFHITDSTLDIGFSPDVSVSFQDSTTVVHGAISVKRALYSILLQESCNPQGELFIVAQPDFSFLINCLNLINFTSLPIEHFISFGYYENTPSLFGPNSFLPNMVLTSHYSMQISSDCESAVISSLPDVLKLCNNFIKQKRVSAFPIFKKQNSFEEYLDSIIAEPMHEQRFVLVDTPYLFPFLTPEMCDRHLYEEELGSRRIAQLKRRLQSIHSPTSVFHSLLTSDGFQQLYTSGRFTEIPKRCYSAFCTEEVRFLLHRALEWQEAGRYRMHVIKNPHLLFPPNLCITAFSSLQVSFVINHPKVGFLALNLQDPSFSFAIFDFIQYLMEETLSHSPEDSAALLRSFLSKQ